MYSLDLPNIHDDTCDIYSAASIPQPLTHVQTAAMAPLLRTQASSSRPFCVLQQQPLKNVLSVEPRCGSLQFMHEHAMSFFVCIYLHGEH